MCYVHVRIAAIDVSADVIEAVRACMRCGVSRVLSSGGAPTALEGVATLRHMVIAAGGTLCVAAGGGVDASNAVAIATDSGVHELHGSFRAIVHSAMRVRPVRALHLSLGGGRWVMAH